MNGLPYYKAYPRDFIEGTIGMSFELKGAYRLVLDLIYMQGGALPDDERYISGLLGCSVRRWKGYREELISMGKIESVDGAIRNFRADKELETSRKLQDKQRENRSRPNKINDLPKPPSDHTDTDTEEGRGNERISTVEKPANVGPPGGPAQKSFLENPEPPPKAESRYPAEFETGFWVPWRKAGGGGGKHEAFTAWKRLSAGLRTDAGRYAAAWFATWRRQCPDASPIHAATYLNKRRWIGDEPRLAQGHAPADARLSALRGFLRFSDLGPPNLRRDGDAGYWPDGAPGRMPASIADARSEIEGIEGGAVRAAE